MAIEIEHYTNLDALAAASGAELSRAAQSSPYDRLEWLRLVAEHCPPPGRPLVVHARDGDAQAWLPLMRDGTAARALSRWYSLRVGPAFHGTDDPARQDRLLAAIGGWLRGRKLAEILLTPMEPALAERVARAFRAAGWRARVKDATANWQVDVTDGDFAAYWAARPGRLRNTVKRKTKAAALEIAIHPAFDAKAWEDYVAIYAQSWKPEEGSPAFVRALAEQEGARGTARIAVAYQDGRPLAAQFWTVEGGIATIHKLSHVKDADQISPGTILSAEMFRHVITGDRPTLIDFGTGDDAYKAEWMDRRRMLLRVELLNPRTLRGLGLLARERVAALVRKRSVD